MRQIVEWVIAVARMKKNLRLGVKYYINPNNLRCISKYQITNNIG